MEKPSHAHIPADLRRRLDETHRHLLTIHKALLDHERMGYEKVHGRIGSPGEFLQLLLHDPWFAWLRAISGLLAQIDEFLASKKPVDPRDGEALLTAARSLLTPVEDGNDFQQAYHRSLRESPEAAAAHAAWKQSIGP